MEFIDKLQGKVLAFDTCSLIYFLEDHTKYANVINSAFLTIEKGESSGITSVISYIEVLTQPLMLKRKDLINTYRDFFFKTEGFETLELSFQVAESAAILRVQHHLRTPDAIQLATAILGKASIFITNDRSFKRTKELEVIILDDL